MSDEPRSGGPRLLSVIPWLACEDVAASISFFTEKLGFAVEWTWGDPWTDGGVVRDELRLYFFKNEDLSRRVEESEITILVADVDALHAEHLSRGAPIARAMRNEPWGTREYQVRAPGGYVLRFSSQP